MRRARLGFFCPYLFIYLFIYYNITLYHYKNRTGSGSRVRPTRFATHGPSPGFFVFFFSSLFFLKKTSLAQIALFFKKDPAQVRGPKLAGTLPERDPRPTRSRSKPYPVTDPPSTRRDSPSSSPKRGADGGSGLRRRRQRRRSTAAATVFHGDDDLGDDRRLLAFSEKTAATSTGGCWFLEGEATAKLRR